MGETKTPTVAEYLVTRLAELGVSDFFGVPGDFNFNICSAIESSEEARWIGCCNELNAGYAADGYARVKGFGASVTTFGVGELSAINAIAGAYSEFVPVFHIVGSPAMSVQNARRVIHHTLGNGDFGVFQHMAEGITAAQTKLTAENAASEIERLIGVAMTERRPVYINLPTDVCKQPIAGFAPRFAPPAPDLLEIHEAVAAAKAHIEKARRPVIVADCKVMRFGLEDELRGLVEKSNLPVATLAMGKTAIDEQHPNFIGTYDGQLFDAETSRIVESADLIIAVGVILGDTNTAAYTVHLDRSKTIEIQHDHVMVKRARYEMSMKDMLDGLTDALDAGKGSVPKVNATVAEPTGDGSAQLSADDYHARMQSFIETGDILVAETGTSMMGSISYRLPSGAMYQSQSLWMSIGWATPAALGAAIAAPDRRVILMTGDGSHQLTAQEVGTMARYGANAIIVVNNNDGYTIERYLAEDPMDPFNDIAAWNYAKLPVALGANDAVTAKVDTGGALAEALSKARAASGLSYIEAVMDKMDAPETLRKIHSNRDNLYSANNDEQGKLGRPVTPVGVAACPG